MAHDLTLENVTVMQLVDLESSPSESDILSLRDGKEPYITPKAASSSLEPLIPYRKYKRRFVGMLGFVVLAAVTGMNWPWFGPISNSMAADFGISLNQANWLGNIVACVYLPAAIMVPIMCSKWGLKRCCDIGVCALFISSWIRYAGTARSLSREQSYALLMLGQTFAAISQPIFQILGPVYSETWFDLKERTTATMIISIANPVGGALGQLISPMPTDTRLSILILGIISTASTPFIFLIKEAPPIAPTYAGSRKPPNLTLLLRTMRGLQCSRTDLYSYMTVRERIDFILIVSVFGVLVGGANAFSLLTAQIFEPVGYSNMTSGLFGAALLLCGLIAAIITAPLFDRVFTRHLAITLKVLVPVVAGAWLSLIWVTKAGHTASIFVVVAIIGMGSLIMLPVGLELGCEITRNSGGSSALLWFSGNLFGIMFVLVESALRASSTASPPLNMHRSLIFNGVFIVVCSFLIFFVRGDRKSVV